MRFPPLTEEEIQSQMLLPDGIYSYRVLKAEEKVSRAGNEYISLTLKVRDEEGRENLLFTNLSLIKLLKHFCDVNDLKEEYMSGDIQAEILVNKAGGRVQVGREDEKPNPNGGFFKAKNIVKDYVADAQASRIMPLGNPGFPAMPELQMPNDEIPF